MTNDVSAFLSSTPPLHLVGVGLVLVLVMVYARGFLAKAYRWLRVGFGTSSIPTAPEGHWLLGHIVPLAKSCAWEKMYGWLKANDGELVKFRIGHRTGVLVGSPEGLKRVFQVGCQEELEKLLELRTWRLYVPGKSYFYQMMIVPEENETIIERGQCIERWDILCFDVPHFEL